MDSRGKLSRDEVIRAAAVADVLQTQQERLYDEQVRQILNKPLPKIPDPAVRVEVLVGIAINGVHYSPGDFGELPKSEAHSQAAIGRVKIL